MSADNSSHTTPPDLDHPAPARHSDDSHSKMPKRDDQERKQAPNDKPGKKPGEGEDPVG